jgi:hypothetical protein
MRPSITRAGDIKTLLSHTRKQKNCVTKADELPVQPPASSLGMGEKTFQFRELFLCFGLKPSLL